MANGPSSRGTHSGILLRARFPRIPMLHHRLCRIFSSPPRFYRVYQSCCVHRARQRRVPAAAILLVAVAHTETKGGNERAFDRPEDGQRGLAKRDESREEQRASTGRSTVLLCRTTTESSGWTGEAARRVGSARSGTPVLLSFSRSATLPLVPAALCSSPELSIPCLAPSTCSSSLYLST